MSGILLWLALGSLADAEIPTPAPRTFCAVYLEFRRDLDSVPGLAKLAELDLLIAKGHLKELYNGVEGKRGARTSSERSIRRPMLMSALSHAYRAFDQQIDTADALTLTHLAWIFQGRYQLKGQEREDAFADQAMMRIMARALTLTTGWTPKAIRKIAYIFKDSRLGSTLLVEHLAKVATPLVEEFDLSDLTHLLEIVVAADCRYQGFYDAVATRFKNYSFAEAPSLTADSGGQPPRQPRDIPTDLLRLARAYAKRGYFYKIQQTLSSRAQEFAHQFNRQQSRELIDIYSHANLRPPFLFERFMELWRSDTKSQWTCTELRQILFPVFRMRAFDLEFARWAETQANECMTRDLDVTLQDLAGITYALVGAGFEEQAETIRSVLFVRAIAFPGDVNVHVTGALKLIATAYFVRHGSVPEGWQHFLDAPTENAAQTSDFQDELFILLEKMRIPFETNVPFGNYRIHFVVTWKGRRIALDANGSTRFLNRGSQLDGPSQFRADTLEKAGIPVASLRWVDWVRCADDACRERLIVTVLMQAELRATKRATAVP